jgi:hypothetical protein
MLFEEPSVNRGDDRLGRMSIGEINSINFRTNKYFQRKQRAVVPKETADESSATIKLDDLSSADLNKNEAFNSFMEASGTSIKSLYVDLNKFYKLSNKTFFLFLTI